MREKPQSYYSHARTDLLGLIPRGVKRILDVGCGEGVLGRQIKALYKDVEVTGIEKDKHAYEAALKNLDTVILADAEKMEPEFDEGYFDCIVAGDILEHLVDPWKILKTFGRFLKNNGLFISSMPNIRYYKVLINLFRG